MAVKTIDAPTQIPSISGAQQALPGWWRCWGWFVESVAIDPAEQKELYAIQSQLIAKEAEMLKRMGG